MEKHEVGTETNRDRGTTNTPAIAPTEQSHKAIAEKNKQVKEKIKEREFKSEIRDFLNDTDLIDQSNKSDINLSDAEQILFDTYYAFFQAGEGFSFSDIPKKDVANVLRNAAREIGSKLEESNQSMEFDHAEQLRAFVDQLKSEGLSNTTILTRILAESETGVLTVPPEKLSEYRNYLKLLNSSSIPEDDKAELTGILNQAGFDITAADSFQQFGKEVLNSRTISESTKQILITEFQIRPVISGNDLKTELLSRYKLIAKRKREIQELNDNLSSLKDDVKAYRSDLSAARFRLESSNLSNSEREKLEKEVEELESAISLIEVQQKEIKDSQKILVASTPKNEIQLGEAKASYAGEQIQVQLPDSRNFLRLPIEMSPEDVTKSVNAYLIYAEFKKRGLEGIVFPDEKLQDGVDQPSGSMMNFVNMVLSTIGMSTKDEILTLENLEEFNRYLDCFSSEEAKGNKDAERRQFASLTQGENGVFLNQKFLNDLSHLHSVRNKLGFSFLSLAEAIN